ncbi:hypothetical protein CL614_05775 [archaeon]|jgi:hypothetical protein|nr:hypothetical protein [archaeon]|tara:strand:+ start:1714 stop:2355 length:642 start_codon:yes stop_codon:yes gene_type:complete
MSKRTKNIDGIKYYVAISLVGVFAVVSLGVLAYSGGSPNTVIENQTVQGDYNSSGGDGTDGTFGAFPGPDVFADINIFGTLITGSGATHVTTTAAVTYTLEGKDLLRYSLLDITNNKEGLTLTMPATSTMQQAGMLPLIGSERTWTIYNNTTTDRTITVAAGDGMDLVTTGATSSPLIIGTGEIGRIRCLNAPYDGEQDIDVICDFEPYAHED